MPSAAAEALAVAQAAAKDGGELDWDLYIAEYERRVAERHRQLMGDARAAYRAVDGWAGVKSQADWEQTVTQADEEYARGRFLIDRIGAERCLDPPLMAVLLTLRRRLIDEHGAATAAELLLVDSAVLAYYHFLRINGWIGDLSIGLEHEFWGHDKSLSAKFRDYYGPDRIRGLTVEDLVRRIGDQLLPLLDRSNRMLLRNLKALRAMREPPAPSVSIGSAGQVNVATNQANAVRSASDAPEGSGD